MHLVVEAAQPAAELLAHPRVERAEGLVEQEHARLDGERRASAMRWRWPPESCAASGRRALELHQREQLVDPLADLRLRPLADRAAPNATLSRTVMCWNAA